MKRIIFAFLIVLPLVAQPPTKLFDVRNGGATSSTIEYQDVAAKTKIVNAFADAFGYQATINGSSNPQSKLQFYHARIAAHIREVYKAQIVKAAAEAAGKTASDSADGELPPQGIVPK